MYLIVFNFSRMKYIVVSKGKAGYVSKALSAWRYRPVWPLIICRYLFGFLEYGLGPNAKFT